MIFARENTAVILIDVQEKLSSVMHERERLFDALERLLRGAGALGIPIVHCRQLPDKLGATVSRLLPFLDQSPPIDKATFSCCGSRQFNAQLEILNRTQFLVAGIETHVCVQQTASDLVGRECGVQIVSDAVSSRTAENRKVGLERCRAAGAEITSVETALFEMLDSAESPEFKKILDIVK